VAEDGAQQRAARACCGVLATTASYRGSRYYFGCGIFAAWRRSQHRIFRLPVPHRVQHC